MQFVAVYTDDQNIFVVPKEPTASLTYLDIKTNQGDRRLVLVEKVKRLTKRFHNGEVCRILETPNHIYEDVDEDSFNLAWNHLSTLRETPDRITGDKSEEILAILNYPISANQKMQMISDLDPAYYGWHSGAWASFLEVSDAAIRSTSFWKVKQKAYWNSKGDTPCGETPKTLTMEYVELNTEDGYKHLVLVRDIVSASMEQRNGKVCREVETSDMFYENIDEDSFSPVWDHMLPHK